MKENEVFIASIVTGFVASACLGDLLECIILT